MFNKKGVLGISIFFIIVSLGFIKINIINTSALSPVGNTEDNYELVKEEFGEEFQEFIRDDAEVKIYESKDGKNNPSVKIGNKEFVINLNNKVTKQIYNIGGFIYNGLNNVINKFDKKSDNNDGVINSSEESNNKNNSNNSNKEVDSIIDNYLDTINNEENSDIENGEDGNDTNEDSNSINKEVNSSNNEMNSNDNTELDNIINSYLESIDN